MQAAQDAGVPETETARMQTNNEPRPAEKPLRLARLRRSTYR
jgi:hypothetical protein